MLDVCPLEDHGPAHLRRMRRDHLRGGPALMVRNLHRKTSSRASCRRTLDSEVLSARKNEPKLVRVVSYDTALPRVGVGCVLAIEREEIDPALGDVAAGRNQFDFV